jgi:hypothetical protein
MRIIESGAYHHAGPRQRLFSQAHRFVKIGVRHSCGEAAFRRSCGRFINNPAVSDGFAIYKAGDIRETGQLIFFCHNTEGGTAKALPPFNPQDQPVW